MYFRLLLFCIAVAALAQAPKTWDEKELADWALLIAAFHARPGHFSEAEYYRAPVDNLREAGRRVFEGLDVPGFRHTEPQIIAKFRSADYIKKA